MICPSERSFFNILTLIALRAMNPFFLYKLLFMKKLRFSLSLSNVDSLTVCCSSFCTTSPNLHCLLRSRSWHNDFITLPTSRSNNYRTRAPDNSCHISFGLDASWITHFLPMCHSLSSLSTFLALSALFRNCLLSHAPFQSDQVKVDWWGGGHGCLSHTSLPPLASTYKDEIFALCRALTSSPSLTPPLPYFKVHLVYYEIIMFEWREKNYVHLRVSLHFLLPRLNY